MWNCLFCWYVLPKWRSLGIQDSREFDQHHSGQLTTRTTKTLTTKWKGNWVQKKSFHSTFNSIQWFWLIFCSPWPWNPNPVATVFQTPPACLSHTIELLHTNNMYHWAAFCRSDMSSRQDDIFCWARQFLRILPQWVRNIHHKVIHSFGGNEVCNTVFLLKHKNYCLENYWRKLCRWNLRKDV